MNASLFLLWETFRLKLELKIHLKEFGEFGPDRKLSKAKFADRRLVYVQKSLVRPPRLEF